MSLISSFPKRSRDFALVDIASSRYPSLKKLAQEQASHLKDTGALRTIIKQLAMAPDEATARFILSTASAA
jgi:hypothetical protein